MLHLPDGSLDTCAFEACVRLAPLSPGMILARSVQKLSSPFLRSSSILANMWQGYNDPVGALPLRVLDVMIPQSSTFTHTRLDSVTGPCNQATT